MGRYTYIFQAEISVTVTAPDADAAYERVEALRPADRVLEESRRGEVYLTVFESDAELVEIENEDDT